MQLERTAFVESSPGVEMTLIRERKSTHRLGTRLH